MVKKTSKPNHLVKRYNTYFAVLYVPKDIEHIIGKAKFSKSTGTDNKKLAETIAQVYVMGWKAEIESARMKSDEPLINSAREIRKLLKSSPAHLVQDAIDEEVAKLNASKKPIHAEVYERIAKGKNKYSNELAITWRKHEDDRGLAKKTIDQMFSDVELVTKQFPTANMMTIESVELWIKHIAKKGNLSASSVNRIIGSGKNFFKYLQFIKEVPSFEPNPFIVPNEFRISNKPNSKSVNKTQSWLPFTSKEIVDLYKLAVKDNQSLADLILIAMHTGARIEEICSLLCKDIDLENECITIVDAKTEAGERTIPIHSFIKPRIKKLVLNAKDTEASINEGSEKTIKSLVDRFQKNIIFIHLPQKDEVKFGRINPGGMLSRDAIRKAGGLLVDGFSACNLNNADYFPNDGHPNKDGYFKIEACVSSAIPREWVAPR